MRKITYEDKINMYNDRQKGTSLKELCNKYNIVKSSIQYLLRLIDKHGFDILRTDKNRTYSYSEKEEMINRVLINGETIMSVAIENGLSSKTVLHNWITKYQENGYNIVERKRGRPSMPKVTKKKENETDKEKIKRLEKENLYLKAELEYSKKLRAVVQARKNRQQKRQ